MFEFPDDSEYPLTTEWHEQKGAKIRELKTVYQTQTDARDNESFSDGDGSNEYAVVERGNTETYTIVEPVSMESKSEDGLSNLYESIPKVTP